MAIKWSIDGSRIVPRWTDIGRAADFKPEWMNASDVEGSHLDPLPDFASHSPFGGATWFTAHVSAPVESN
jgi:hypothetical protein